MLTAKLLGRTEGTWYQENSALGLCLTEELIYSPPFSFTMLQFLSFVTSILSISTMPGFQAKYPPI